MLNRRWIVVFTLALFPLGACGPTFVAGGLFSDSGSPLGDAGEAGAAGESEAPESAGQSSSAGASVGGSAGQAGAAGAGAGSSAAGASVGGSSGSPAAGAPSGGAPAAGASGAAGTATAGSPSAGGSSAGAGGAISGVGCSAPPWTAGAPYQVGDTVTAICLSSGGGATTCASGKRYSWTCFGSSCAVDAPGADGWWSTWTVGKVCSGTT